MAERFMAIISPHIKTRLKLASHLFYSVTHMSRASKYMQFNMRSCISCIKRVCVCVWHALDCILYAYMHAASTCFYTQTYWEFNTFVWCLYIYLIPTHFKSQWNLIPLYHAVYVYSENSNANTCTVLQKQVHVMNTWDNIPSLKLKKEKLFLYARFLN